MKALDTLQLKALHWISLAEHWLDCELYRIAHDHGWV